MTPAGVTEVLLLAVVGGEAVLGYIRRFRTVAAGDDFDNHELTLARHSHHLSLTHYPNV